MRVRELIKALEKLNPDLDLLVYTEDEDVVEPGQSMRFLYIDGVSTVVGVTSRDERGRVQIDLGLDPEARMIATLDVTSQF